MKRIIRLPLYLSLLTQCSKCKNDPTPAKPEDRLPPATQTGAGTFGCLLNGQPWTPSGNNGTPNFLVTYDPVYHGGNLAITVYRTLNSTGKIQSIGFGGDQISQTGVYPLTTLRALPPSTPQSVSFYDESKTSPCNDYDYFFHQAGTTTTGQFTITRLDKQKGIVSGTFQFTMAQPNCDTIKVTQGRFDSSL
jgi:hypothetical protein